MIPILIVIAILVIGIALFFTNKKIAKITEEEYLEMSFSGPWSDSIITGAHIQRIGEWCRLYIKGSTANNEGGPATYITSSALPEKYRPKTTVTGMLVDVVSNNVNQTGVAHLFSGGKLIIYATVPFGNFSTSGNVGFKDMVLQWTVNN